MTKRHSHKPPVARRRQTANRKSLLATRHRRHARFEALERRDLLTAGLDWDAEPFMATMLWEESPDDGRVAEVWADVDTKDGQFGLLREPMLKAFSVADAELVEADTGDDEPFMVTMFEADWGDDEPFMTTMFLEDSSDYVKYPYWEDADFQDGDYRMLGEPMLMAFAAFDAEMVEADWGDDQAFMTTMFLEDSWDDVKYQYWEDADLQDGDFRMLGEPMLMAFAAFDAEMVEADWGDDQAFMTTMFLDESFEITNYRYQGEDFDSQDEDYGVLRISADDQALDEPVFRTLFTSDEEVVATGWNDVDAVMLDDDSLDAEIMLFAMGPSPWQNLDIAEDVNADGWATPIDVLLIINGIGQEITLSPGLGLPVSLFLDVNGDRRLDASDAIQVINVLNGVDQTEPAADIASDQAPLWYDDRWAAPSVREGNEDSDSAVSETWEDAADIDDSPWAVSRVAQRDDESADLDQDDADEQLFSEDADWLLGQLL
jgi:hypothetical protein